MNKEYTQGFIDKCAEAGLSKEASSALAKRLLTLSDKSLERLSPYAVADRAHVLRPAFKSEHPKVSPKEALTYFLRRGERSGVTARPADRLAAKKPGSILEKQEEKLRGYW